MNGLLSACLPEIRSSHPLVGAYSRSSLAPPRDCSPPQGPAWRTCAQDTAWPMRQLVEPGASAASEISCSSPRKFASAAGPPTPAPVSRCPGVCLQQLVSSGRAVRARRRTEMRDLAGNATGASTARSSRPRVHRLLGFSSFSLPLSLSSAQSLVLSSTTVPPPNPARPSRPRQGHPLPPPFTVDSSSPRYLLRLRPALLMVYVVVFHSSPEMCVQELTVLRRSQRH